MERPIPIPVSDAVTDVISRHALASITGFTPSSGGCVNHGGRLQTTAGERFEIYNLYPLLVHLHLFGSSYNAPIQSTLNAFV
ncbi:MAG TPA: fructosamine kinase family protein [Chryseolinea sp.]|nr:fructosamine kinase family protein [Chryseolinea sp.]